MLDLHGIFVYDERGPNGWRPHVRLFPDAKRRNDVEERSTLKRRRLLLETCDRPEASAPLPRHASKQLHQRRPPTPTIIQTTGPPPPPRSRARPHPPEPKQEPPEQQAPGSWNGASRERALTKARPPEEPRQHTPRDRRSLNNTHQPGQAGSAMPPPNIQQAHEVNPGSEMDGPSPPATGPKSRHSENIGTS